MLRVGPLFSSLVFWLLAAASCLAVRTVVIDAGHGGHDRGGGPGQRIPEKPYTLDVARRLASRLRAEGFRTVLTRHDDSFISLSQRCAIANRERNAIFVSIHFNSAPNKDATGIETYYYSRSSAGLAAAVHRRLVAAARTENRGVRRRAFYVIRRVAGPAILCECGFLTNREEASRITGSASHRQRIADGIAAGIVSRSR